MSVRRLAALGAALLALAVLTGCGADGGRPVPPQRARLGAALLPGGDARLDLRAAGRLRSDAAVRDLAGRLAAALFPDARDVRVRTRQERGMPYARAEVDRAYRTGSAPSVRLDTAAALRLLSERGFRDTAFDLDLPAVPATVRPAGPRAWRLRADAPPPAVAVELRPRPLRWAGAMALPVLGAAGVALGFFVRRRVLALPAAGLAVAAACAAPAASAGRQGDNLGVAGLLGGTALDVATAAPLAAVPLGLPAAMLLGTVLVRALTARPRPRPGPHEARPRDTGLFW